MNLLEKESLAEVNVVIRPDGSFDVYQSKVDLTPEIVQRLCRAFLQLAVNLAKEHGIKMDARVSTETPTVGSTSTTPSQSG